MTENKAVTVGKFTWIQIASRFQPEETKTLNCNVKVSNRTIEM